jgi:hypothetical protein
LILSLTFGYGLIVNLPCGLTRVLLGALIGGFILGIRRLEHRVELTTTSVRHFTTSY